MSGAVTMVLAAVLAALPAPAAAARWLTPDWGRAEPPACAPVALFWFTVDTCPLLYRTEVDIPRAAAEATVLVRSSGYVYVQVDGRQVYGWTRDSHPPVGPPEPISAARVHAADLTRALTPGRHVLSLSAPAGGVALDGVVRDAGGRPVARLRSDARWRVAQLAATTVIEDDPIARPGHAGAAPVRAGRTWTAPPAALRAAATRFAAARARADDGEARWRAELLAESGRYIVGSESYGWGGGERIGPTLRAAARAIAEQPPATAARPAARKLAAIERLSRQAYAEDEARALGLLGSAVPGTWPLPVSPGRADLAAVRTAMESALGHPANHLNESRYDRLGWIDMPGLVDNDVRRWGVRLNPVTGEARGTLPQPWRFAPDPDDRGLRERWWLPGFNADDDWPTLATHDGWTNDARFADYRGIGWYRNGTPVPDQCAGEPIVFTVHQWGDVRIWINGEEITASRAGAHPTRYTIPPELLAWSGDNVVAVRAATTDLPKTGIGEPMEFTCPTLDVAGAAAMPPVDVLATPLSPAAVWMPRTASIELRHAGTLAAGTRSATGWRWTSDYDARRDGRLPANWILLDWRAEGRPLRAAPVLLVFERNPLQIASVPGRMRIRLHGPDERVVAVRPWGDERPPGLDTAAALERLTLWSRAARALPINYLSVTRQLEPAPPESALSAGALPPGPLLEQTMVYDYLRSSDDWGTAPLELAPLPALASYALERRPAALEVRAPIEVLQPAGTLAPYRVARGADRLSYRYRVEPYPRLAGFTAWMFSGFDAGVPGNRREVELIAGIGANSFRPQHNDSHHPPPPRAFPEGDQRARVDVLADYCRDAGINYMPNVEQTLGAPIQFLRERYDELVSYLDAHYQEVARRLADRPFRNVAYDLVNEPNDHDCRKYGAAMRTLTDSIRRHDPVHLIAIEPCGSQGALDTLPYLQPTGDPRMLYSFHDYRFRPDGPDDRWPTRARDISAIFAHWLPAVRYQIEHGVPLHCGEFGDFASSTQDSPAQRLLLNDLFRVLDQFGMHHHFYSNRGIYQHLADGSLRPSEVVRAYRAYFARPDFNAFYPPAKAP